MFSSQRCLFGGPFQFPNRSPYQTYETNEKVRFWPTSELAFHLKGNWESNEIAPKKIKRPLVAENVFQRGEWMQWEPFAPYIHIPNEVSLPEAPSSQSLSM